MNSFLLTASCVAVTVGSYCLSRVAYRKRPSPLTTPVFFSTTLIILLLLAARLEFDDYSAASDVMTFLLGPATVALAVPLYKNRRVVVDHGIAALVGLALGCVSTMAAVIVIAKLLQLSPMIVNSLSVKSVTVAIAIELSTVVEGNPSLAAGFVIATGMLGAMLGPWLMNAMRITHPVARGLSLGTISHGQGTAQAALEGELQGSIAGVAMGVAAVFTAFAVPVVIAVLS